MAERSSGRSDGTGVGGGGVFVFRTGPAAHSPVGVFYGRRSFRQETQAFTRSKIEGPIPGGAGARRLIGRGSERRTQFDVCDHHAAWVAVGLPGSDREALFAGAQ